MRAAEWGWAQVRGVVSAYPAPPHHGLWPALRMARPYESDQVFDGGVKLDACGTPPCTPRPALLDAYHAFHRARRGPGGPGSRTPVPVAIKSRPEPARDRKDASLCKLVAGV